MHCHTGFTCKVSCGRHRGHRQGFNSSATQALAYEISPLSPSLSVALVFCVLALSCFSATASPSIWSGDSGAEQLVYRCMLGQNYTIERRKPETRCFNGREYHRPNSTGACDCQAVINLLSWDVVFRPTQLKEQLCASRSSSPDVVLSVRVSARALPCSLMSGSAACGRAYTG